MKQIFLTQASLPDLEEYIEEIRNIWNTHWVTSMGPKHNLLEKKIEDYLGINGVTLFTNGHNALEAILNAFELKGEVITTPFSFISTTHAIVRNGLMPVFCDITEHDFNIDADKIERLITDKTSAILATHIFGTPCNVEKIEEIAKKYNLKVIYDAAHAFGVKYKGKGIAAYGDASIFSFHASKVFNSLEGGCVVCSDRVVNDYLMKYRNFGNTNGYTEIIGTNAKMNEFSAAMGLCNLRHIDTSIGKRKKLFEYYCEELKVVSGVMLPEKSESFARNYSYFPIRIDSTLLPGKRDDIFIKMNNWGIQVLRHFYPIVPEQPCYKDMFFNVYTPIAKKISEEILLLPLYEKLQIEEAEYIIKKMKELLL